MGWFYSGIMQGLYTPLWESGRSSWAVGYLISLSQRQTRDFKGGTKKEEPCLISAQLRGADLGEDTRRTDSCQSPLVERKAWQKLFPSLAANAQLELPWATAPQTLPWVSSSEKRTETLLSKHPRSKHKWNTSVCPGLILYKSKEIEVALSEAEGYIHAVLWVSQGCMEQQNKAAKGF